MTHELSMCRLLIISFGFVTPLPSTIVIYIMPHHAGIQVKLKGC